MSEAAVRVDAGLGIEERVEFLETPDGRIFSTRHAPEADSSLGIVICPPIYNDFMANYRREVMLAREMAQRGFAVRRLHYRGTGNSDGDPGALTLERQREDVSAVVARLRDEGCERIGFLATRWGALVAARAAQDAGEAPLVLWSPVVDPRRYLREGLRAEAMRAMKEGEERRSTEDLQHDLAEQGWVDLMGYRVHRTLLDSADGTSLVACLGDAPRPVLVVQLGQGTELKGDLARVVEQAVAAGFAAESAIVDVPETWWFFDDRILQQGDLVDRTARWLDAHLREGP